MVRLPAAQWSHPPTGSAFSVGDLGHLDADGYLWIDGRRHDLIISGGVNVYPAQVESALLEHPGVLDAAGKVLHTELPAILNL